MKDDMLNALLVWGDRSNRDTAHLLDIAIAGTIEQTIGHGTVILRPARLEEIVSRIAPRERDEDGGWKVTLLPDDKPAANTERTSEEIASLAGRIMNMGEIEPEPTDPCGINYNRLLRDAKRLAGSALTQRG